MTSLVSSIISLREDVTGSTEYRNPSVLGSGVASDDLATQGAKASTTTTVTYSSPGVFQLAPEWS